jgi:uncharacterized protein DUF499
MSTALEPWYAVATPHEDIRKGRLDEAIFAANIWAVVDGTAPDIYLDAEQFFRKTYLTTGLVKMLTRVAEALAGAKDAGDRIVSLQTAFGGGKTHTLVALWHLARNAEVLRRAPACEAMRLAIGVELPKNARPVAVFTNRTCDATQGRRTPDGTHTRTLWGEIAWQLGGRPLYEKVRPNDERLSATQGLFAEILRSTAPCLILLDEIADYCVGAAAVPVGETTLADQTISFIQELTEAVQQVPGAIVVATLPASKLEVAQSEKGQEAFVTLEKRFYRLGADVKPIADEEIYEVVRTRLFESVTSADRTDLPAKVADAYQAMYREHEREVPSEVLKASYRDDLERAYPFHPALIDALYKRWGSHPDFQRTRGVLRLLATIVGDLWNRRNGNTQSQALIQPCHVNWALDPLGAALTRLWGQPFQSVSAADVVGDKSNAGLFDEERGGDHRRETIGRGIAAAILLGSFGGQGERSGFSAKDVKVACGRPGLNWSYTDGALLELENRCFYLHTAAAGSLGKRYWFGSKPTLNKLVVQYRQRVETADFDPEILASLKERVRQLRGANVTWRALVDPQSDLPEQKSLTLLVLPPAESWGDDPASQHSVRERVLAISQRCGGKDRHYRNTLLFLAASARGVAKLRRAYREREALLGVRRDYAEQLDQDQRVDLAKRVDEAERAAIETLGPAYTVALRVRGQDIAVVQLQDARSGFEDHLEYVWRVLVEDEEWILRRVGGVTLQGAGLVPRDGAIRLKDAIEAFLRFTDKPMVASNDAVVNGLAQACVDGLVGIARGPSASNLQVRVCRKQVSLDPSEDGVWIIPAFHDAPQPGTGPSGKSGEPVTTDTGTAPRAGGEHGVTPGTGAPRAAAIRRIRIEGAVPLESYNELFRCFIGPAARMNLKRLTIGVGFVLEAQDAVPLDPNDPTIKAMREAARQLGLSLEMEE